MDILPPNFIKDELDYGSEGLRLPPKAGDVSSAVIDKGRLGMYESWAEKQGAGDLFKKLVDNIRFIGGEDLKTSLDWMRSKINSEIGDDPYLVLYDAKKKSGKWLFDKLGLRKPVEEFGTLFGRDNDKAKKFEGEYKKIVFVNDAAYSGRQDAWMLRDFFKNNKNFDQDKLSIFYIGITNTAKTHIKDELPKAHVIARYLIPVITQIFDESEQIKLKSVFDSWPGHYGQAVLTLFEYKVPDNFFGGLRRRIGQVMDRRSYDTIYLIDDTQGGVYPEYHK